MSNAFEILLDPCNFFINPFLSNKFPAISVTQEGRHISFVPISIRYFPYAVLIPIIPGA